MSAATQFDAFIEWFVKPFLANKAQVSRDKAAGHAHNNLPVLGKAGADGLVHIDTVKAINAQLSRLPYRADPLTFDYYTHPGVTQRCLDTGNWGDWACDCDDFAVYAHELFRLTGAKPGHGFWIWNLIINPAHQLWDAWANHVVLGVRVWDGKKFWTAVLDTNSASSAGKAPAPIWFDCPPEQVEAHVLAHFSRVYKVQYYRALRVDYPF